MALQLIATQTGFHSTVSQPDDAILIVSPGWELFLELFSEFNTTDAYDSSMDWGQLVADQFGLLDGIEKQAILNVVSQVAFSDDTAKEFVKIVNETMALADLSAKELTKYVMDQISFSHTLSAVPFIKKEVASTLTLIDKVKFVFSSHSGVGGGSNIHHGARGLNKTRAADTSVPKATTGAESDSNKYSGMESDPKIYTEEDSQNI